MENEKEKILEAVYFYFQNQKYKKAIKILKKEIINFPDDVDLLYNLAILYESVNEFDKARDFFKKVLELDKNNEDAKKHLEKLINR